MSADVHRLANARIPDGDVEEGLVERLEALLVSVRAGEIRSFAYATEKTNGNVSTGWWRGSDRHGTKLIGAVATLQFELLRSQSE